MKARPLPADESPLARADRRWKAVVDEWPDLRPAVEVQQALVRRGIELLETLRSALDSTSVDAGRLARLAAGQPLLHGEPRTLPVQPLTDALFDFCQVLEAAGAGESAAHIKEVMVSRRLDPASLLKASLGRADCAVRDGALQLGLSPDLLWLVGELATAPYAYLLQQSLIARLPPGALATWSHGYCPVCGSWPAFADRTPALSAVEGPALSAVEGSTRTLKCSFCVASWPAPQEGCIYCGERGEAFSIGSVDEAQPDRMIETCQSCGGYLKSLLTNEAIEFPLLAVEDLATADLDAAAAARGFRRPPLKRF